MADIEIRNASAADRDAWLALWAGYNHFYESDVPAAVTEHTWQRILDPHSAVGCRVLALDGKIVGFANYVLHDCTWEAEPICYLEDLFMDPSQRGKGLGRALIDDLLAECRKNRWSRLYWHTRQNNPARKLYDEFVKADDFVKYALPVPLG